MVVTAIFVILSAVVLANNTRFGNRVVLENLAHDIALSIRQAQVYGIAVKRTDTGVFNVGYGMHFTANAPSYELFADLNDNGVYDVGETVKLSTLASGYRIDDICARASGSIDTCGLTEINILFIRPEPDALIRRSLGAFLDQKATIVVKSNRDDTARIITDASGQISVQ